MDGAGTLAGVSVLMFVGSYAAGLLPMLRAGNAQTLQLINAAGAGLLVGAALCVVLPEGFITFAEGQAGADAEYPEWVLGCAVLLGFLAMLGLQLLADQWSHAGAPDTGFAASRDSPTSASASSVSAPVASRGHSHGHLSQAQEPDLELTTLLPEPHSGDGTGASRALPEAAPDSVSRQLRAGNALSAADQVLYGLVVHAAADGVAVGAACLSASLALSTSVAGAILIHKFPVAFGLSAYLRGAGWYSTRLQKGLLLFCASAPVAAVLTYLVAGGLGAMKDQRNVALCLLFSGGTVLHAGLVHVLPSVLGSGHDHLEEHHQSDGGTERKQAAHGRPRAAVLAVLAASSFVPLIVNALVPEAD